MPGKVFISCGQNNAEERSIAAELRQWFKERGFFPYVAIQAQSIQDINSAIISELKSSDYYIFIDFPRELFQDDPEGTHRGSLFTHQEMAIAYILGFERVLFLRHKDVRLEGLLKYTASNAIEFSASREVLEKVRESIEERGWMPSYTRHLLATNLTWSKDGLGYRSHSTGEVFIGKFLYIDIENRRPDFAAFNTVARLGSIIDAKGNSIPVVDRSHLKVTGQPGYFQTIFPESHGAFDLLCVKSLERGVICLNSSLDLTPKPLIISEPGSYILQYEVLSELFPILKFSIRLNVTGESGTTQALLLDG